MLYVFKTRVWGRGYCIIHEQCLCAKMILGVIPNIMFSISFNFISLSFRCWWRKSRSNQIIHNISKPRSGKGNWTKEIGICQCCQMAALWMLFVKGDPLWRRLKSQWCVHILEFLSSAIDNISHMHSRTMDFDWTWFRSKSIYLFYINIPNRAIVK